MNRAVAAVALFCMTTQTTFAALINLAQAPLFIGNNAPPKVMLTISKDQQLYKKAYNDYTDLDGDGIIDTTYKHTIRYYGYFDSSKCYIYSAANNRFEPQLPVFKDPLGAFTQALCNTAPTTGQWSGNFLNWVAMTRMDAVRKLLYGGLRSTDTATDSVLERAFVPTDAHAWAKYYNPDPADAANQPPINQLTPFNPPSALVTTSQRTFAPFTIPSVGGDYDIDFQNNPAGFAAGDQIRLATATGSFLGAVLDIGGASGKVVKLRINAIGVVGAGTTTDTWNVTNLSATGISFCNLTTGPGTSQGNTNPPLIRVAQGNYGLWNANERWQCQWFEEQNNLQGGFSGVRSNGNQAAMSEIAASAENPSRARNSLGTGSAQGEFIVRILACPSNIALHGSEKCTQYPSGNYKPTGLMQKYGDTQRIHFGLMTGSYEKNISGGVLRKNVGSFANEVLVSTNGRFNTATAGIVQTLNKMRIYGYNYGDGSYLAGTGDNCTFQLTSITEGSCTSWGNPMSEVFFEAVRYFAGQTPTAAYAYSSGGSKDTALGLAPPANWTDPLTSTTYCAPLNVLVFNASVSSNDDDLRGTLATSINSGRTIGALTDAVGTAEGITNGKYFTGRILGTTPATDPGFELCTAKTVTALGDVSGICPEGPTLAGSYLIAGIAHHARANRIRTDLDTFIPSTDTKSLKVTSYGIQLASNTPQLTIPVPRSATGQKVVIQPIYRLDLGAGNYGGGALVDLKYVRTAPDMSSGKVYINWEDSEQGGDYDQDMWGTLEWRFVGSTIVVTSNAVSASTRNPQGFGYTISGTTQDGPHFPSGILSFNFADPSGVRGCTNCQASSLTGAGIQSGPQAVTYNLGTTPAANTLKDPLWYLAKYGGFNDSNSNGLPDVQTEWDVQQNRTSASGADGEPDNYFLVTNPLGLETALERALRAITESASASSIAANSTSLRTGSAIYGARFDAKDWSGRLAAQLLNPDGTIKTIPEWEAERVLPAFDRRVILTFDDNPLSATYRQAVPFRWSSISPNLQAFLNTNPDDPTILGLGAERLDYLRGDGSREGATSSSFRQRPGGKLGDIVNSSPAFVPAVPNDAIRDSSYKGFRDGFIARPRMPMLYVGANDGMLHGFDATATSTGGVEKIAYVPSKTFKNLNQLTSPNYIHRYYVDATPGVGDAQVAGSWKTVLVGAYGGGGQGLFALDVTDPSTFSEGRPSTVLWEFNDTDDVNALDPSNPGGLGYVYSQPIIRKMTNGRWAAIVSGGYNNFEPDGAQPLTPSVKSSAYLYIIFLEGPTGANRTWQPGVDYVRIDTNVGTSGTPNGLAQPFVADVDFDGIADFIYAGDLVGNFWKFDVSQPTNTALPGRRLNLADWQDARRRVKLYAGNQPITAQAEGTAHPTGRGFMLMFGTGKYLEPTDAIAPYKTQSFYGIWDKNDSPTDLTRQTTVSGRGSLFEQLIQADGTFRTIVPAPAQAPRIAPNWSTQLGWFMDFPTSATTGERSVFDPVLASGRLIFTTLLPSGGACEFGGTSYVMVINPATGGRFDSAVLDVNGDGNITSADVLRASGLFASGIQSAVGITPTPTVIAGRNLDMSGSAIVAADGTLRVRSQLGRRGNMIFGGSAANGGAVTLPIGLSKDYGRVTWREVLKK